MNMLEKLYKVRENIKSCVQGGEKPKHETPLNPEETVVFKSIGECHNPTPCLDQPQATAYRTVSVASIPLKLPRRTGGRLNCRAAEGYMCTSYLTSQCEQTNARARNVPHVLS